VVYWESIEIYSGKEAAMKLLLVYCVAVTTLALAAGWQTQETSQWIVRYKGSGTLTVMEGKHANRETAFDGSDFFAHYIYEIEAATSYFWGVTALLPALVLVENSDAQSMLQIKPKPGIAAFTQPVQIVGSNASFKSILVKTPRGADQMVFGLMGGAAAMIDGDVAKFTTTARLIGNAFAMRNIGLFSCRSSYYSYLLLGTPQQYISNAYATYAGDTNDLVTLSGGDLGTFKADTMQDTMIFAGCAPISAVYTADLAAVYNTYPPSGTIGKIQAKSLCGVGRFHADTAKWLPTCLVVGAARPEIKMPATHILTEGSSVFINQ